MRVNLAKEQSIVASIDKRQLIFLITFFIFISSVFAYYYFLQNKVQNLEKKINIVKQKIEILQKNRKEYLNLEKEIKKYNNKIEDKDKKDILFEEQNWNLILLELSKITPDKTMLNSLNIRKNELTIKGMGANGDLLSIFLDQLSNSDIFDNIVLQEMKNNGEINYIINANIVLGKEEK